MLRSVGQGSLVMLVVLSGAVLAGCGDDGPRECPTQTRPGLAIAAGARANSPAPAIPAEIDQEIFKAMDEGKAVTIIRVDGRPSVACSLAFHSSAGNDLAKQQDRKNFDGAIHSTVAGLRAREPEADVLGALSAAAAAAGPGGTVALIDSGLQTKDPLDLRKNDLLMKNPQDIADELARRGLLPDLRDRKVYLVSLGYTAEPQPRPDNARQTFFVSLWSAIVTAAGTQPIIVAGANTAAAVPDAPPVGVIALPSETIAIGCNTESVLPDDGTVGFVPDTTIFVSEVAARTTLRQFGEWLGRNPRAHAVVTGTIAHYGADTVNGGLALDRAVRVRDEIVALGATAQQVEAHGDGWGPFPDKAAPPGPEYDQRNRRVVITITC